MRSFSTNRASKTPKKKDQKTTIGARFGDGDDSLRTLRLLRSRGADVAGAATDPSSPLSNVVHNGCVRATKAVLEAGADPDEGRCCGPPLLMGSGVWHDGDVLCPCCWLDRTPAGALDPDLPSRRAKILAALLDAGADPARTHAAAPGLTAARGVLRHLRTLADDREDSDDDDDAAARLQDLGFSALVPGGDDDVGMIATLAASSKPDSWNDSRRAHRRSGSLSSSD